MQINHQSASRVAEKFATDVEGAAQDYERAASLLASLRAQGKTGPTVDAAVGSIDVTRRALEDVLRTRFPEVMTEAELAKLTSARETVAQARQQLAVSAFAPGVVVEKDSGVAPLIQAIEMLDQAAKDGKTYGRLVGGKPLVVGPGADLNRALADFNAQPALPSMNPTVDRRLSAEQSRALTASLAGTLAPADREMWNLLQTRFPDVTVNVRSDGSYYLNGLPDRLERRMICGLSADGSTPEKAFREAVAALTRPHDRLVTDQDGERKELTWDAKRGDWLPYESTLRLDAEQAVIKAGGDARVALEALADVPFPDVKLAVLTRVPATTHRDEVLATVAEELLRYMLREIGDSPSLVATFEQAFDGLTAEMKSAALAAVQRERPESEALKAYAQHLAAHE